MVVPSTLQITPRLCHVGQQKIHVQGPDGESHVLSLDLGAILIGQLPPVVVFERVSAKEQDGKRVAVYEGWVRSDVAEKRVHVIWPSDDEEVAKKARERLHFVYEPDTVAKLSFD